MTETDVLILTNERDFAADDVIRWIRESGASLVRLNHDSAVSGPVPAWGIGDPARLPVNAPRVVWWRQFETDAHPSTLAEADDLLVERGQWRTWLARFEHPNTTWVNDLWAARRAENKIEQLRSASAVGFDVPATVVTNDPAVASRFRASHGAAVVKTLAAGYFSLSSQAFVFTEELDDPVLSAGQIWFKTPVIVQELLAEAVDVRVVSFGHYCFGARCSSRGIDWRKTPFDPDLWDVWDVPHILKERCSRYRERLGLEYVAFDFMERDGSLLFLEANQAGEWMFLDRALNLGISKALAGYLVNLARSN
ncbi:MAG: hypothetical protein GY788_01690 [bacterium]|nr:hypothetical protein [bacterium]